jgi:hypothetical protein
MMLRERAAAAEALSVLQKQLDDWDRVLRSSVPMNTKDAQALSARFRTTSPTWKRNWMNAGLTRSGITSCAR